MSTTPRTTNFCVCCSREVGSHTRREAAGYEYVCDSCYHGYKPGVWAAVKLNKETQNEQRRD